MSRSLATLVAALMLAVLTLPGTALAQQASGIAGTVRDTSGALLPGVKIERTA